jgi:hypothetical protein
MKKSESNTKTIVRDDFTQKLINVHVALVKKDALGKKKDFADVLGITYAFWNHIEARRNNFPKDAEKRMAASKGLAKQYNVSTDYLLNSGPTMFTKEPSKVKEAVGERVAGIDFTNKAEKKKLLDELDAANKKIKDLEAQVKKLTKSDNNPDKPKKK